jgi:Kef-type K+ transport system membrane component KefB
MNAYWVAAAWMGMALLASLISIRVGISVALIEIVVGAVVGNIPGHSYVVQETQFTTFLATIGSAVLVTVVILSAFVPTLIAQKSSTRRSRMPAAHLKEES